MTGKLILRVCEWGLAYYIKEEGACNRDLHVWYGNGNSTITGINKQNKLPLHLVC